MIQRITIHSLWIKSYFFGWFALAFGITVSKTFISVSYAFIGISWLLIGDWGVKYLRLKKWGFYVWIFPFIYLLFLASLFYTQDFKHAWDSLRVKMPLFLFPFAFFLGPIFTKKHLNYVFFFFVSGVLTSTIVGFVKYFNELQMPNFDRRLLSPFVSHIPQGQAIALCCALLFYMLYAFKNKWKYILLFPLMWLYFFSYQGQSLTLLIALGIISILLPLYINHNKSNHLPLALVLLISVGFSVFAYKTFVIYTLVFKEKPIPDQLPQYTINLNEYQHNLSDNSTENGYRLHLFVQETELEQAWMQRSNISLDTSFNSYPIKSTLIRYLTSKNLPKDSLGVYQLTQKEIEAIECGVSNVFYLQNKGIFNRIHQSFWELKNFKETNYIESKSLILRWYYWKIAYTLFKQNVYTGIGVGDVKQVYLDYYAASQHQIPEKDQKRAHSQWLTNFLTLGVFGASLIVVLCIWLGVKAFSLKGVSGIPFLSFFLVIGATWIYEDALESLALVALLMFSYCFTLYIKQEKYLIAK